MDPIDRRPTVRFSRILFLIVEVSLILAYVRWRYDVFTAPPRGEFDPRPGLPWYTEHIGLVGALVRGVLLVEGLVVWLGAVKRPPRVWGWARLTTAGAFAVLVLEHVTAVLNDWTMVDIHDAAFFWNAIDNAYYDENRTAFALVACLFMGWLARRGDGLLVDLREHGLRVLWVFVTLFNAYDLLVFHPFVLLG